MSSEHADCDMEEDVRVTPDGEYSVVDSIVKATGTSADRAANIYRRMLAQRLVPPGRSIVMRTRAHLKRVHGTRGRGGSRAQLTPVATKEGIAQILAQLPHKLRTSFARSQRAPADDLYIMQYSIDQTAVKIGRAHNVEGRRRQLESGQNFFVKVLRVFPGCGPHEIDVHKAIAIFRSNRGAGVEWFNLTGEQAIEAVCRVLRPI